MSILQKHRVLKDKLDKLSPRQRVIFAADCAEHALPQYEKWSKTEGLNWGNPNHLRRSINLVWMFVESNTVSPQQLEQELEVVNHLIPDTEDFPDASGMGALDAGCAVSSALGCAKTGSAEDAALAGEFALFAADECVGRGAILKGMSQQQLQEEVETDSEQVINEFTRQIQVLDKLEKTNVAITNRNQFIHLIKRGGNEF